MSTYFPENLSLTIQINPCGWWLFVILESVDFGSERLSPEFQGTYRNCISLFEKGKYISVRLGKEAEQGAQEKNVRSGCLGRGVLQNCFEVGYKQIVRVSVGLFGAQHKCAEHIDGIHAVWYREGRRLPRS